MTTALTLPQSLLLLTLKDDTGRPKAGFYRPAIAGAGVSELLLRKRLTLTDEKKPKLITVPSPTSQSPFLDLILETIAAEKKPRDMRYWVTKLGNHKAIIPTLGEELCALGALTKETSKVFGLFTRTSWPEASSKLESQLKLDLEKSLFGEGKVDDRSTVTIALAKAADVLKHNFDKTALKTHKKRIKEIAEGDLLAVGVAKHVIEATQAAIVIASITAATVATAN